MFLDKPEEQMKIIPIGENDLTQLFEVYRQSEDFLALGPVPLASKEMVLADLDLSQRAGGIFCGVYTDQGNLAGVLDYVPSNFSGHEDIAFIELLMIAAPYRRQRLGETVMAEVEQRIWSNPGVSEIHLAVQTNNPVGQQFWRKLGYEVFSGPQAQPDGTTVYYMKKLR